MKKFKVELVKDENGVVIGVKAGRINNRDIILALEDIPEWMSWREACAYEIPTLTEWLCIQENIDKVDKILRKNGNNPIRDGYYWTYDDWDKSTAWIICPFSGFNFTNKLYCYRVRCKVGGKNDF